MDENNQPPPQYHNCTDLGNAYRFSEQNYGRALFDARFDRWRFWDGRCWMLDAGGKESMRRAYDIAHSIREEANGPDLTNDERRELFHWAQKSESKGRLEAMVHLAKNLHILSVPNEHWDAQPWLLNVQNGIVNLHTGELLPHNYQLLLTKVAPVDYYPSATYPVLDRVLREALEDEATRVYLQRVLGYALCGEKSARVVAFIYGPKGSGKSTMMDAFRAMLGEYAVTVEPEVFSVKSGNNAGGAAPQIVRLAGTRLALMSETAEGQKLDTALVKRVSGGDNLTGRTLYSSTIVEFRPQFLLAMMSNHRPVVSAEDDALWDRMKVVPFNQTVPKERRDEGIKWALEHDPAARSALLAWAVQGCMAWVQDPKNALREPDQVLEATSAYKESMDEISPFISAHFVMGSVLSVSLVDIRQRYDLYCQEMGIRNPISPQRMAALLEQRGFMKKRTNKGTMIFGLGLVPESEAQATPFLPHAPASNNYGW